MKYISTFLLTLIVSFTALAELDGDGYYRVQNYKTSRYVYVTDNTGELNYQTTSADMNAIELWKGFTKASSDPATVLYIMAVDSKYDIQAQGTGIYEIIGTYVNLRAYGSYGTYLAYGTSDGITKYLSDGEQADADEGILSDSGSGEYRYWYILPISATGDNYFGVNATEVNLNGYYYQPFYAEFPFSTASSGMEVYYISNVDNGMAVLSQITGTVPGETPVFIKTANTSPSANLLNIGGSADAISGNQLVGVYFDNDSKKHYNRVAYDSSTMRMLGTTSDGSLGYITPTDLDYIPANYSYLSVADGTESELTIVTEDEYNEYLASLPTGISLSKTTVSLIEGETETITATVTPSSATQTVTWTSSNESVATVDDNGTITAVEAGSATITATTVNSLTASCEVTVTAPDASSISLDVTELTLYVGSSYTLTATVLPENAADKTVTWTSSSDAARVTSDGNVTGISSGSATITATTVNGLTATCSVTVSLVYATSIELNKSELTLTEGDTEQLTATTYPDNTTVKDVHWTTSDESVATVSDDGLVTAVKAGSATITVYSFNYGVSSTCAVTVNEVYATSITLDKTEITLEEYSTEQLTATVLPDNTSNKTVTWTSSDEAVATVDADGMVTAVKAGTATVTATTTNGLTATCSVTVYAPDAASITLDKSELVLNEGGQGQLTATVLPENAADKTVTWTTSDATVATVSTDGLVNGVKTGTATVTATTINGLTATCTVYVNDTTIYAESITLNLTETTIYIGDTETLVATVLPTNTNDKTVTWTTSDATVATVDDDGAVTGVAEGEATITATTSNGLSATCKVTVVPVYATSITLNKSELSLFIGSSETLIATVLPDNTTVKTVAWSSSNTSIATVDDDGTVTVVANGTATITASTTDGTNLTATCMVYGSVGIMGIYATDPSGKVNIYTLSGVVVKIDATQEDIRSLEPGTYIIGNQKVIKK